MILTCNWICGFIIAKAPGLPACLSLSRFVRPPSLRLHTRKFVLFPEKVILFLECPPPCPSSPPYPPHPPSPDRRPARHRRVIALPSPCPPCQPCGTRDKLHLSWRPRDGELKREKIVFSQDAEPRPYPLRVREAGPRFLFVDTFIFVHRTSHSCSFLFADMFEYLFTLLFIFVRTADTFICFHAFVHFCSQICSNICSWSCSWT